MDYVRIATVSKAERKHFSQYLVVTMSTFLAMNADDPANECGAMAIDRSTPPRQTSPKYSNQVISRAAIQEAFRNGFWAFRPTLGFGCHCLGEDIKFKRRSACLEVGSLYDVCTPMSITMEPMSVSAFGWD